MRRKLRRRFQVRWAAWADSLLRLEERRSQKSSQVDGFWRDGCWVVSWILHLAWETLLGGQLQKKKADVVAKGNLLKPNRFAWTHVSANFWATLTSAPGSFLMGAPGGDLGSMERITPCPDQVLGWGMTLLHSPSRGQALAWTLETLGDSEELQTASPRDPG